MVFFSFNDESEGNQSWHFSSSVKVKEVKATCFVLIPSLTSNEVVLLFQKVNKTSLNNSSLSILQPAGFDHPLSISKWCVEGEGW